MREFRKKYPGVWLMRGWLYLHVVTITVPTAMFSAPIFTSVTQKITRTNNGMQHITKMISYALHVDIRFNDHETRTSNQPHRGVNLPEGRP